MAGSSERRREVPGVRPSKLCKGPFFFLFKGNRLKRLLNTCRLDFLFSKFMLKFMIC